MWNWFKQNIYYRKVEEWQYVIQLEPDCYELYVLENNCFLLKLIFKIIFNTIIQNNDNVKYYKNKSEVILYYIWIDY